MRSKTLRSAGNGGPPNDGTLEELDELGDDESNRGSSETASTWRGSLLPRGLELANRYRIERFVARGGMGEVYVVQDGVLGERVALKTVASQFADDTSAIEQLKIEVQLARRVSHKNVCRIYDLGTHGSDDGNSVVFLTMEYIEGISLGDRLKQEPRLSVFETREIAVGILEGLAAAHDAGVLHRDLKSDNVMLRPDRTGRLEPILMDFGLASALNPNSSRVSGDRALIGSLAYMAPEQLQGEPLRVATDLYAFGVILFEMLTGRLPFVAATPAMAAIRRLQEDAPRLTSLDPTLPEELDRVVQRCLERDPKRRYTSAFEVIHDLEPEGRLSTRSPSSPRLGAPTPPGARGSVSSMGDLNSAAPGVPRQRMQRSRWLGALVLALGLSGIVAASWYFGAGRSAPRAEDPRPVAPGVPPVGSAEPKRDEAPQREGASDERASPASDPGTTESSAAPETTRVVPAAPDSDAPPPSGDARSVTRRLSGAASPKTSADAAERSPAPVGTALVGAAPPGTTPSGTASPRAVRECPEDLLCPEELTPRRVAE